MAHLQNDLSHGEIAKRLWEEKRYCDDMLTRIATVRAVLDRVGKAILEQHIQHCIARSVKHSEPD
jgi:DNA-binding FrmR family transcriptional regulator